MESQDKGVVVFTYLGPLLGSPGCGVWESFKAQAEMDSGPLRKQKVKYELVEVKYVKNEKNQRIGYKATYRRLKGDVLKKGRN